MLRNTLAELLKSRAVTAYWLSNRTRVIAKDRGLRPYGVALGTLYNTVNNPEHVPSGEVLGLICAALDCQPGDFLEYVQD